jgi:putative phosphoesterase
MRIGLISDTHGLLRPEALDFLAGCDHIVHGGDIGDPDILERLAAIAPLTVVRGNNDTAAWAGTLPGSARLEVGGVAIHVVHDVKELDIDPAAAGVRVVVSGHSHKPACVERGGVLYVNPGSAGRRRFTLPIAAGELLVEDGRVSARLVTLAT